MTPADLDAALRPLGALDRLRALRERVPGRIVFTTSLGIEDQALAHMIFSADLAIDVVTLETGRLFPETYAVWAETEARYGRRIRPVHPEAEALEALVARHGVNGFRHSVEARKACCGARKIAPLRRTLQGAAAWVTGLRADQSDGRAATPLAAPDEGFGVLKVSPLVDWSREAVVAFVEANGVPVNALHGQGFPSIGCQPCTRAVRPGEPERAGRWWWEADGKRECGLHLAPDGRLVRQPAEAGA